MSRLNLPFPILTLLLLASCSGSLYYTAAPIDAVVVDAETNLLIGGAMVVANWQLATTTLHGYRYKGQLEVKETSTDKAGRFHFDGFTKLNPFLYELLMDPQILIFKSGYEYERINNNYGRRAPGTYRKAAVNGRVVKLKKLAPVMAGKREVYHMGLKVYLEPIVEDCEWKKISRSILAMDAEKRRIIALSPTAEVWIMSIEDLGRHSGCGSAEKYFRN